MVAREPDTPPASAPTALLDGGQPPAYGRPLYAQGYDVSVPSYVPKKDDAPVRKKRKGKSPRGIAIGSGISIILLIIGFRVASSLLRSAIPRTSGPGGTVTAPTTPPGTPAPAVLYQNTFTVPDADWADQPGACFSKDGAYHVADNYRCFAPMGVQYDFDVTVQVRQLTGSTRGGYGLSIRDSKQSQKFYLFLIDSNGKWAFLRDDVNGSKELVPFTSSTAITGGLNTVNTIEVRASGSQFEFFINGTNVGRADDVSYRSGYIALYASEGIEVAFNNLIITEAR